MAHSSNRSRCIAHDRIEYAAKEKRKNEILINKRTLRSLTFFNPDSVTVDNRCGCCVASIDSRRRCLSIRVFELMPLRKSNIFINTILPFYLWPLLQHGKGGIRLKIIISFAYFLFVSISFVLYVFLCIGESLLLFILISLCFSLGQRKLVRPR